MIIREIKPFLRALFYERLTYIDRANIWLDTDRQVISKRTMKAIRALGKEIKVIVRPMNEFQPEWKQIVQLYQVTPEILALIDEDIRNAACDYMINRVELTLDWTTPTMKQAKKLHFFLRKCFIHQSGKAYYFENLPKNKESDSNAEFDDDYLGTSYFADKKKHKIIPVIYSDKRSKINGKPCTHMEYKLSSARLCAKKQIVTIRQLMEYDIVAFFKENVTFSKMPSLEKVGMAICEQEKKPSKKTRRGYEKDGKKYFDSLSWNEKRACLQKLLQDYPKASKYIERRSSVFHMEVVKALLDA